MYRDGGAYRPRESGASGRGGRGGGGGGGRGYGGGFNRGPPRDYEGAEAGERQGGEDRGYGGGRGGRGGARGDRSGQGERRGYGRDALTSEQLSQRQALNQAIREASSWRDLASFVEEKGSVMDAENVASILFKLTGPRPGGRQGGRGGDQSYGSDFARPRDEAASAEYDRLLSTLLGWVLVLMPNFRPRQVTLTLQSLAKLELWNVEVVTALVAACIKQMGNLEPADYSNIMWSFAKFNYSPGQEFFDAYLTGSARKLGNMTPIDLAKLALSMSKLGCIPTAEWAEAFWKASSDNVADMSEMSTGDVLMATVRSNGDRGKHCGCSPKLSPRKMLGFACRQAAAVWFWVMMEWPWSAGCESTELCRVDMSCDLSLQELCAIDHVRKFARRLT